MMALPGFTASEAPEFGVDAVLLDDMTPETMRRAVAIVDGRAIIEASGRITLKTAPAVAATGVDLISCGWITAGDAAARRGNPRSLAAAAAK